MLSDQEAIESDYRAGMLLDGIGRRAPAADRNHFLDDCVALHNAGRIDLIGLLEDGAVEKLSRHDFFPVQHFYCKAIPRLTGVSAERMMRSVAKLVGIGGEDLAANLPNGAFFDWCIADLSRADAVITAAKHDDVLAIDHLTFALQAKGDLQLARDMATGYGRKRRLAALTALSRIVHAEPAERAATVDAMMPLVEAPDDSVMAHVLTCVVHAHESGGAPLTPAALAVVGKALSGTGDHIMHGAAHALLHAKACLSPELVALLLTALRKINPEKRGTIDLIDAGLHELPRRGFGKETIAFARDILERDDGVRLEHLDSFARDLAEGDPAIMHGVMARWLLSGNRKLCEAASELVRKRGGEEAPVAIDFGRLGLSDVETFFVCRKAIGYLFLQPVVAGSVLVSALRTASDNELRGMIRDLLFDPLLINYGGGLRVYLASIAGTDAAQADVAEVLKRGGVYVAGLEAAGSIEELQPSEYRRQLERIRMVDFNREVNKKARRQSIFWDIVHRSVLLHGRHSLSLVEGVDGEKRAVEMKLHTIEHSVEWPRMETVDPVGLDMRLRIFRAEQMKS